MSAESTTAAAPGRVNLIGEHTDYNGGFVLPSAIPQQTRVTLHPRPDRTVTAHSHNATPDGTYQLGHEAPTHQWTDYVQGITWALATSDFSLPSGFDLDISSDVPLGAGLSSSAALEVALLRALRTAFGLHLDDVHLARLGQLAENDFVGAHCGIMDQMAAALADAQTALFLDARSLEYRRIPLPAAGELVVLHSGVSHHIAEGADAMSDYNARRADCEQAAALLGVPQLRDLTAADLPRANQLPAQLARRARHVITEDDRVLEAVSALEAGDLDRLGELFYASHVSMRDDFEVSTPEMDLLVELARAEPDIYGARLTGGGFGGATINLVAYHQAEDFMATIARRYEERTGIKIIPGVCQIVDGAN
jgi:galactokinase